MAYDRYDRDERSRHPEDRSERAWRDEREHREHRHHHDHDHHGRHNERGFFERAGDEISSWFGSGSDRDERRHHDHDHDRERGIWRSGPEHGRDQRPSERSHSDRDFNENRGLFNRGGSSERDYNRDWNRNLWGGGDQDRERERGQDRWSDRDRSRDYRPMAGDYGRGSDHASEEFFAASGVGTGERGLGRYNREQRRDRDYGRSETPYGRDDYRQTSFAGSRKDDRDFDPHYRNWRDRHMSDMDHDYDEFRREHQSRFESDFGGWREKRQQKRGMLGQVREHMEVVGSDEEHVGTVDKVAGDRIILTKSDAESGGSHHSISCSNLDRVEGNRVILDCKADEAKKRWRDEDRSRALFERHEQGEDGPGILNRSFSGTYRDR